MAARAVTSGPPPAGVPLPAVARRDALRATWAGERFDLDLAVGSTRWAQLREGALPPCSRRAFPRQRRARPRFPDPVRRPWASTIRPCRGRARGSPLGKRLANGRAPGSPSWNAGGDGPAWSRKRQPFEPPAPERRRGPSTPYAELHCHSNFSFLDGASHPEELAEEAARLDLVALALTDHDGLYGVVRFAEAARAVGLPTVFGAEITLLREVGISSG